MRLPDDTPRLGRLDDALQNHPGLFVRVDAAAGSVLYASAQFSFPAELIQAHGVDAGPAFFTWLQGERDFRADDHEIGLGAADELEDGGGVGGVDIEAFGLEGHAAVTGGDAHLGHPRTTEAGLEQGVFPAAGAEDEDVEFSLRSHVPTTAGCRV